MAVQPIIYKSGERVGNFIFIRETEGRLKNNGTRINRRADFRCKCGKVFNAYIVEIKHRGQKTCGCIWNDIIPVNKKHNGKGTREYQIWKGMRKRCNNVNSQDYKDYGGRGIKVCEEWSEFQNFLNDMGLSPSVKHSIDRKNVNLGYNKNNCRWATSSEQAINRRTTVYLTHNCGTATISQWSKWIGMPIKLIQSRRNKRWPDERILTTPKLINQFV